MANTKSAKKAARQGARRTIINKSRRSRMRSAIRKVEEAIAAGDHSRALGAMTEVEPALIRAAQKGIVHRNSARRKVSRLAHQIAKQKKKEPRRTLPIDDSFFATAIQIVDCNQSVALLSRHRGKVLLCGDCAICARQR
jgi:small subunit ribosomal protein S20